MDSVILEIDALSRMSGVSYKEFKHIILKSKTGKAENNDINLVAPIINYKIPENNCLIVTRIDSDAKSTNDEAGAANRSQFNYLEGSTVAIYQNDQPLFDLVSENFKAFSDTHLFLIVTGQLKVRFSDLNRISWFTCRLSGFLVKQSIADFFLSNTTIMNFEVETEADHRNTVLTREYLDTRESAANRG